MAGALTAAIASIFSGSAVTADPYFEYTTLLLPGNGTNGAQNNTFLDSGTANSGSGFTITRNGNTTQGTFSPFSQTGWGNYFDGTGDYLTVPSNAAFSFGTSDYSMEFWMYCTSYGSASQNILDCRGSAGSSNGPVIYLENGSGTGTKQLRFSDTVNTEIATASNFPINNWTHVVATRSGTTTRLFTNGTLVGTSTSSVNVSNTGGVFIGAYAGGLALYIGYLSNVRIVKGSIPTLYQTSSTTPGASIFTPPTSPLTAISGTSLLTCQSNRFIDNSTNSFTITVNGDTRVVAFSPFNPTASWSAATNGGSGYFDGSGDYLSIADNAAFTATGDFCLEAWCYLNSLPADYGIVAFGNGGGAGGEGYSIRGGGSTAVFSTTSGNITSASQFSTGSWIHVALLRSGTGSNNVAAYVNGTRIGTQSSTTTFDPPGGVVGRYYTGTDNYYVNGYVSGVRVVVGSAVYQTGGATPPATITVPTAPLTAITNTSLLLNFTNAGIYDATSKNDLETVGNAQISNTTAKWGSTSIYMAAATANTDYLVMPASRNVQLGSGDFTIEFWMRPDSVTTSWANSNLATMLDLDPSAGTGTDWWFIHQVNNTVQFGSNATTILTSSASLVATTWQYIALVRSGSGSNNLTFYINGTASGSATYTATIGGNRRLFIGTQQGSSRWYKGYLQDIRITPGVARTITTPTAAFPTL